VTGLRERVLELARGGLAAVEAERRRIDDLNVYPVPDGDTGTNLTLTVQAVVDALEESGGEERAGLAHQAARAALMGARGNSGVILSQIIRGAADSLRDSDDLAAALRSASDAAYRAVRTPAEGTMLTAIRELAEEAEAGGDLAALIARGEDCVARTRELLPVLREAGVVDAGAAGLMAIARGIVAVMTGEAPPRPLPETAPSATELLHHELSRFRYCTVFVVEGSDLDPVALERAVEPLGDSLLVVGDRSAVKIHVHTDDPGKALSAGVAAGAISGVEIADMHVQTRARDERLLRALPGPGPSPALSALVAVASGAGNRRLLESLGAVVVDGGRTMNPSTAEILAAVEAVAADGAILLPNDANVLLTARQAAENAARRVTVVPTVTLQAGLAAAVAFDPEATPEANLAEMAEVAAAVSTGAVTVASREVSRDGLRVPKGSWLGLAEGEPIAGGSSFDEVAREVVERLLSEPRDVLTLLSGEDPQPLDGLIAELRGRYPELELEVHDGGQPHYPLLLSAE
jgi:DAK2 domain fusion protein YloV